MQGNTYRQTFFTTNYQPSDFRNNWQSNLINPLVDKFMGSAALLGSHDTTPIKTELFKLITSSGDVTRKDGLCAAGCDDAHTLNAATAACAGALASAALTLQ
jgi:hypothetical protein